VLKGTVVDFARTYKYEGHLKSSWTRLTTSSRNFVEVFSKHLPWQAMHFLQRSTHLSKTCCRPLITSKCASKLPFHGWKNPEIAWAGRDLDCMADVLMGFHRSTFSKPNTEFNSDLAPMRFLGFSNNEKRAPRQDISK
jgi:hypothetical protein